MDGWMDGWFHSFLRGQDHHHIAMVDDDSWSLCRVVSGCIYVIYFKKVFHAHMSQRTGFLVASVIQIPSFFPVTSLSAPTGQNFSPPPPREMTLAEFLESDILVRHVSWKPSFCL